MSNLLAAIGRGQLKNLEDFIEKEEKFIKIILTLFPIEGIDFMSQAEY